MDIEKENKVNVFKKDESITLTSLYEFKIKLKELKVDIDGDDLNQAIKGLKERNDFGKHIGRSFYITGYRDRGEDWNIYFLVTDIQNEVNIFGLFVELRDLKSSGTLIGNVGMGKLDNIKVSDGGVLMTTFRSSFIREINFDTFCSKYISAKNLILSY